MNSRSAAQWIEISRDASSHVRFEVQVNGQNAVALLDSGATVTAIDRQFARKMGLEVGASLSSRGLSASIAVAYAEPVEITAGGKAFGVQPAVLSLSVITAASRAPADLILGQDIFRSSIVDLDFPNGQLRFLDSEVFAPMRQDLGPGASLNLTADRLLAVPLALEGNPPLNGAIDLGSNVPLYVSPAQASADGLLRGKRVATTASAGLEGIGLSHIAMLSEIKLGISLLRDVPVQIPVRWNLVSQAVVGLPVLRRFRVIFDCMGQRVWLRPSSGLHLPFSKDRSGIGAVPAGDRLRVIHVSPGSPSDTSGISAGDEIVSVNGCRIDEVYLRRTDRDGARPAGTVLKIVLADGRHREIQLADYF